MSSALKRLLVQFCPPLMAFLKGLRLLYGRESYLSATGLMKTYRLEKPFSPEGEPLPWMNYAVIAFLKERLTRDMILFEYGSGYSTLFYAARVRKTISVEHDKEWLAILRGMAPGANVTLLHRELDADGAYCRSILEFEESFDVVIIDGRDRNHCARLACERLSPRGVIVFDDSQREKYADGIQYLLGRGFKKLDFEGLKPTGWTLDRTSIFYKPDNCLNL